MLPFKLAGADESLSAQGGLALFGKYEYLDAFSAGSLTDHELPAPHSTAGYSSSAHVSPKRALNLI
jgi:hypothetical protein